MKRSPTHESFRFHWKRRCLAGQVSLDSFPGRRRDIRAPGNLPFAGWTVFHTREPPSKQERHIYMTLTPILAELAGNLHVGLAALGAAMGVGFIGMKASEAVGRNPGAATKILVQSILAIAFAEAIVFYALFLVK